MCNATLLRGDSLRGVALADMAMVELPELSMQQHCRGLSFLMDQGKQLKVWRCP